MKRFLLAIQIVSSIFALLSKYFLAVNDVLGWWFGVACYIMVAIYNSKANLKIYTMVGISLTILTAYGGYKWIDGQQGLELFDYLVAGGTVFTAILMALKSYVKEGKKEKNSLWFSQTAGTIIFMVSFLLLGWGEHNLAWSGLLVGHVLNTYVYKVRKAYFYVILQIISMYIALAALFNLPLLFAI